MDNLLAFFCPEAKSAHWQSTFALNEDKTNTPHIPYI